MALAIVLLWGVVVSGQESHWAYERRTDNLTHDPFVNLTIQGRYVGAIPVSHSDEAPTLGVSCSNGTLDAIVISTGVVIDSQFGTSPRILTRIDDQELKGDRAVPVLLVDSKTLRFNGSHNRIGGTDMLFAKKYVVAVESHGARVVEMEFDIPSDSSRIQNYCGVKPKQAK